MSEDELSCLYNKSGKINTAIISKKTFKQSDLYINILNKTNFLPQTAKLSERLFCIKNNINHVLLCCVCQKNPRIFLPKGFYSETCSDRSCIQSNPSIRKKRNNTMIQKYGSLVSSITREKAKQRAIELNKNNKKIFQEKYNVINPSQLQHVKIAKQNTLLKNWGVKYPTQSMIIKEKIKQTNIQKYGVPYAQQSLIIKNKIKVTNKEKYGTISHKQKHNPVAFEKLCNYDWLYYQYVILNKTANQIAVELGLSNNSSTVCRYLQYHNILIKQAKAFSYKCIQWLESTMKKEKIFIQHAQNKGEYIIGPYVVDGYCAETNTVYEFHGDRWHGNPRLFASTDHCHPFDCNVTAGELYSKTLVKEQYIRDQGFNLIVKWETE